MKRFGMAVIGLGVVGRRMLEQAGESAGVQVVSAWDSTAAVRAAAAADFPGLPLAASAAAAIERLDVDVVYVAVPPLAHAGLVRAAIAAGKAVFCEKPLGVDVAESAALVEEIGRSGLAQAVNFVFASSDAVDALRQAVTAPAFGLRSVEIRTRFHEWPRAWQAGAAWLQRADQGGFTREVLSHYVYLLHRVLGGAELVGACVTGPADDLGAAETALSATLRSAGVPVTLVASVGGTAPDLIEARFVGDGREWRLSDWYRLETADAASPLGRPAAGLPADPRRASYQRQLAQLQAMLSGESHSLPDFADALAVQRTVEAMLQTRG
jgi:1,5-anhydro-D-fructose reductase (1,5-anhydro-D-mannitol-forming)